MLANDLTGQLARERVTDLHRQAELQRLVGLARTQRRGGNRGRWRGWHLLVGSGRASGAASGSPRPPDQQLDHDGTGRHRCRVRHSCTVNAADGDTAWW
jgi:hypothetical protein